MDFGTPLAASFNKPSAGPGPQIIIVSAKDLVGLSPEQRRVARDVVDLMGRGSAKAQGLGAVITTHDKMISAGNHRLLLQVDGSCCQGLLKVGSKRLFIRSGAGSIRELEPLCVLDFYVHESMQRRGIGRRLFDEMLRTERTEARLLGYDRPSEQQLRRVRRVL
jgi:alpha-tubulin N-acetyltransferase 1